jgi:hypothetical protein
MVRDRRCFLSGAHGRALSCGRLHDESGDRDSAADGRDNDGKKGQPMLNGSRSSVIAWELGQPEL